MTADGPGFHNAYMVRPDGTTTRARKQDGTYRTTAKDTTFDAHGRAVTALDKGDTGDLDDDRCTTTEYADNTDGGRWMLAFPETVTLHTGSCAGATAAKTVTLYDGATAPGIGNKPTAGLATETRTYRDAADYKVAKGTYDKYGRPQTTTAPNGTASEQDDTTTLTYQPADGWPSGGIKTVNPLGHTTWSIPDRRDGATTKTVDANNNITLSDYDKLGRLIRVWGPTEPKPANPAEGKPTVQFTYTTPYQGITAPTGPTVVKSEKLQSGDARSPNWLTSWGYLDGFGRTFETQTRSPSGTETGAWSTSPATTTAAS